MRWLGLLALVVLGPRAGWSAPMNTVHGASRCRVIGRGPGWFSRGQTIALALDPDGRLVRGDVRPDGSLGPYRSLAGTMGYKVDLPRGFPFSHSIPEDEVPVMVRRVSSPPLGWRTWVVLTTTLAPYPPGSKDTFEISNRLRVFREGPGGEVLLLERTYLQVADVVVEDVNGDGMRELAVQSVDGEATEMP